MFQQLKCPPILITQPGVFNSEHIWRKTAVYIQKLYNAGMSNVYMEASTHTVMHRKNAHRYRKLHPWYHHPTNLNEQHCLTSEWCCKLAKWMKHISCLIVAHLLNYVKTSSTQLQRKSMVHRILYTESDIVPIKIFTCSFPHWNLMGVWNQDRHSAGSPNICISILMLLFNHKTSLINIYKKKYKHVILSKDTL